LIAIFVGNLPEALSSRQKPGSLKMKQDADIRTSLTTEDIHEIVRYHTEYYAANYGFNHDFGRYVMGPLTEFYERRSPAEGIWLLDDGTAIRGCVALVRNSADECQLRWFYVDETLRGQGHGQKLMELLIGFAAEQQYKRIILWTVSLLNDARRVYERNGFVLDEQKTSHVWGMDLLEQKYVKEMHQ
jgi:GNAT superfamily N-acetyltransferase